ncbi:unnamed protein product [Thelazia callipaeda]|uniref:Uncharacterized protein n=1 Tax=Thelazia callipaeda TaxID=103827 RepID=A0A0N5CUI4_THECL|nr:unnamed protein product [Thelazia callipaeda]
MVGKEEKGVNCSYWDLVGLTTREWLVVLYAVIIVLIIISLAGLIIYIVRSCCCIMFMDEELQRVDRRNTTNGMLNDKRIVHNKLAERDVIIAAPQQMQPMISGQQFQFESPPRKIDRNCPLHGRKKYYKGAKHEDRILLTDEQVIG